MISSRHFSHFETSLHSDARYGRLSLSPVSASFAARQRANVVLKTKHEKFRKNSRICTVYLDLHSLLRISGLERCTQRLVIWNLIGKMSVVNLPFWDIMSIITTKLKIEWNQQQTFEEIMERRAYVNIKPHVKECSLLRWEKTEGDDKTR